MTPVYKNPRQGSIHQDADFIFPNWQIGKGHGLNILNKIGIKSNLSQLRSFQNKLLIFSIQIPNNFPLTTSFFSCTTKVFKMEIIPLKKVSVYTEYTIGPIVHQYNKRP